MTLHDIDRQSAALLTPAQVEAYLARIGLATAPSPDSIGLARLQSAHLDHVPFENLDIHLGRPLSLEPDRLFDKIVTRRRGGFCYELNGLFASLLKTLGFAVTFLSARVAVAAGSFGREFDHLVLRVDLAQPWLTDVGFGDAFSHPLRLEADVEQADACKVFKLLRVGEHWDYCEGKEKQSVQPQYRFTLQPRRLADFAEMCLWQQTAADSHFVQGTICTRARGNGRITINGRRLIETRAGVREEREIASAAKLRTLLETQFGITDVDCDRLFGAGALSQVLAHNELQS